MWYKSCLPLYRRIQGHRVRYAEKSILPAFTTAGYERFSSQHTHRAFGMATGTWSLWSLRKPNLFSSFHGGCAARKEAAKTLSRLYSASGKRWNAEDDAKLLKLREEGRDWSDIASHFPDRTERSVTLHYYHIFRQQDVEDVGQAWKHWTTEEQDRLQYFASDQKLTVAKIAQKLKRSPLAIVKMRRRIGIASQYRRYSAEEDLKIRELVLRNLTWVKIATHLPGRNEVSAARRWRRLSRDLVQSEHAQINDALAM